MNNKKSNRLRPATTAVIALVVSALGLFPGSAQASPSDEISRAVVAAGATSVAQANAKTFIQGFSSVIVRVNSADIAKYVTAAVKLRPDLVSAITVAAIKAHRGDGSAGSCAYVDPIIRAAILAAPDAKKALVSAAIESAPWARECIVAAVGPSGDIETAFFRPSGVDAGNINSTAIGTINPANIGATGQASVNTPEK
jgi:hypothetical protein